MNCRNTIDLAGQHLAGFEVIQLAPADPAYYGASWECRCLICGLGAVHGSRLLRRYQEFGWLARCAKCRPWKSSGRRGDKKCRRCMVKSIMKGRNLCAGCFQLEQDERRAANGVHYSKKPCGECYDISDRRPASGCPACGLPYAPERIEVELRSAPSNLARVMQPSTYLGVPENRRIHRERERAQRRAMKGHDSEPPAEAAE